MQEISESKRLPSDQKTGADKAFEYYKQHGTYKEYEYSKNDSNTDELISESPVIPASGPASDFDMDSFHSDDTFLSDKSLSDHSDLPHVRSILSVEHF